eukprot:88587_1
MALSFVLLSILSYICSSFTQNATVTPSNPSRHGITVAVSFPHNDTHVHTSAWPVFNDTNMYNISNAHHLQLSLNNAWRFHPSLPSNLSITLNTTHLTNLPVSFILNHTTYCNIELNHSMSTIHAPNATQTTLRLIALPFTILIQNHPTANYADIKCTNPVTSVPHMCTLNQSFPSNHNLMVLFSYNPPSIVSTFYIQSLSIRYTYPTVPSNTNIASTVIPTDDPIVKIIYKTIDPEDNVNFTKRAFIIIVSGLLVLAVCIFVAGYLCAYLVIHKNKVKNKAVAETDIPKKKKKKKKKHNSHVSVSVISSFSDHDEETTTTKPSRRSHIPRNLSLPQYSTIQSVSYNVPLSFEQEPPSRSCEYIPNVSHSHDVSNDDVLTMNTSHLQTSSSVNLINLKLNEVNEPSSTASNEELHAKAVDDDVKESILADDAMIAKVMQNEDLTSTLDDDDYDSRFTPRGDEFEHSAISPLTPINVDCDDEKEATSEDVRFKYDANERMKHDIHNASHDEVIVGDNVDDDTGGNVSPGLTSCQSEGMTPRSPRHEPNMKDIQEMMSIQQEKLRERVFSCKSEGIERPSVYERRVNVKHSVSLNGRRTNSYDEPQHNNNRNVRESMHRRHNHNPKYKIIMNPKNGKMNRNKKENIKHINNINKKHMSDGDKEKLKHVKRKRKKKKKKTLVLQKAKMFHQLEQKTKKEEMNVRQNLNVVKRKKVIPGQNEKELSRVARMAMQYDSIEDK